MSLRKNIFGVGLLLAATSATTTAHAQQPATDYPVCTPKPESTEEAKRRFIAARADYEDGSYDSALKRFREAYYFDCKPELLLLIASTWERKGDKQQTLAALEIYTQRAPKDAPDMVSAQNRIDNLKKELAKQPAQPAQPPPPPAQPEQREHTIYPWLVVGGGVVAVAIGVVLLATAPAVPANCQADNDTCTRKENQNDEDFKKDQDDAGRAVGQSLGGLITVISGGALIAGGVVWHFLEPTGPKEKSARLAPAVGPGFAGLSFTGKF